MNRNIQKISREVTKWTQQGEDFLDMVNPGGPKIRMKMGEMSEKVDIIATTSQLTANTLRRSGSKAHAARSPTPFSPAWHQKSASTSSVISPAVQMKSRCPSPASASPTWTTCTALSFERRIITASRKDTRRSTSSRCCFNSGRGCRRSTESAITACALS